MITKNKSKKEGKKYECIIQTELVGANVPVNVNHMLFYRFTEKNHKFRKRPGSKRRYGKYLKGVKKNGRHDSGTESRIIRTGN